MRILRGDWLQKADPARGRFRSLLLKSLQNFLNDAVDRSNSRKRGGHISFISWDVWIAEAPSQLNLAGEARLPGLQNDFSTRLGGDDGTTRASRSL